MYRYFIQPQLNKTTQSLIGYELLLKEHTDQGWRPPASFASLPADIIADQLVAATSKLALKIGSVSVNLNRTQMLNPQINRALMTAQDQLRPVRLTIELTEEVSDTYVPFEKLEPALKEYTDRGMEISLDDVGSGLNMIDDVRKLLPYTSEIKFAVQDFTIGLDDPAMIEQVIFWRDLAAEHHVRFILEGVEDVKDDGIADKLNIDNRQGYFYGKPHLLKLSEDDPV